MKKPSRFKHDVHKYTRVERIGKNGLRVLWRCTLPNCRHYLADDMIVGQLCVCNRCELEVFVMERIHQGMKKPHCDSCTRPYKRSKPEDGPSVADIAANLDNILKGS